MILNMPWFISIKQKSFCSSKDSIAYILSYKSIASIEIINLYGKLFLDKKDKNNDNDNCDAIIIYKDFQNREYLESFQSILALDAKIKYILSCP